MIKMSEKKIIINQVLQASEVLLTLNTGEKHEVRP